MWWLMTVELFRCRWLSNGEVDERLLKRKDRASVLAHVADLIWEGGKKSRVTVNDPDGGTSQDTYLPIAPIHFLFHEDFL